MLSRTTRRSFLLGAAGAAFALPTALRRESRGGGMPARPLRLVLVMQNNGTQQANFWPRGEAFSSNILEPLLRHPNLAAKTTVVRGVSIPQNLFGTDGNSHDAGFARMFTGAPLLNVAGKPWGGGPSVDTLVARAWGVEPLTLAVLASVTEPFPKPGYNHRRSFSYVAPGVLRLPTVDPFLVYRALFPADGPGEAVNDALRRRLLLRQSVLDSVAGDMGDLSRRLGPRARAQLELHADAVRRAEAGVGDALRTGVVAPAARCAARPTAPRDFGRDAPNLLVNSDEAIPELVTNMVDLTTAALVCGLRRVVTLQFGFGGGKWRFGWEGINRNFHDEIAHLDFPDAGSSALNTDRIVRANRWYASQIARLALALDAAPDGPGGETVLDNTLIVWANEMGRGNHDLENVPVVMIGRSGGALPRGGRLIDAGRQPFNRVGCSVLNLMGVRAAGFGDAPACGMIQGLV